MYLAVRIFDFKWGVPGARVKAMNDFSLVPAGIGIEDLEQIMDRVLNE
jgi:hypothetical protein